MKKDSNLTKQGFEPFFFLPKLSHFRTYLYNKDGSGIVGHALGKCVYPSYNFGLRPPEIVSTPPSTRHTK